MFDVDINKIIPLLGSGKMKGEEFVPEYCPFCFGGSGERRRDKETFAVNIITGAFN